jgi:hypothetical protein
MAVNIIDNERLTREDEHRESTSPTTRSDSTSEMIHDNDIDKSYNNTNNDNDLSDVEIKRRMRRQVGGAAVVGGLVGTVLAGPITGLVTAGGAAALASSKHKNKATNVARSVGDSAADVGDKVLMWGNKHRVSEKISTRAVDTHTWVSTRCKENKAAQRVTTVAVFVGDNLKKWDEKNGATEKVTKSITTATEWVSTKINASKNGKTDSSASAAADTTETPAAPIAANENLDK